MREDKDNREIEVTKPISCSPDRKNKAEQQNILSTALTLLSNISGIKNHRISALQKALSLAIICKTLRVWEKKDQ
jgi:hypothetical protein